MCPNFVDYTPQISSGRSSIIFFLSVSHCGAAYTANMLMKVKNIFITISFDPSFLIFALESGPTIPVGTCRGVGTGGPHGPGPP